MPTEQYQEVSVLHDPTTYERGKIEGKLEERRRMALRLLEAKFGPLSPAIIQQVEALAPEQLDRLVLDILNSPSLKDLHLRD